MLEALVYPLQYKTQSKQAARPRGHGALARTQDLTRAAAPWYRLVPLAELRAAQPG